VSRYLYGHLASDSQADGDRSLSRNYLCYGTSSAKHNGRCRFQGSCDSETNGVFGCTQAPGVEAIRRIGFAV